MGKSTISMVIFNSKLLNYQRVIDPFVGGWIPHVELLVAQESEAPFVVWCGEGGKHRCVSKIVEWYSSERNVTILDEDVQLSIAREARWRVLQLHHLPQISKNGRNDQQRPVVLQRTSTRAMPQRCRSHMDRIYQLVAGTEGNVCSGEWYIYIYIYNYILYIYKYLCRYTSM